ncbi:MAG: aldo/keto reductase, partial [Candidatus Heimdallarchaeota archaeon]
MSLQFNQRSLGKSSIKITPIGLGAWQFSEGKNFNNLIWKSIDSETTNEIISQAVKAGINWIDTAEYYGKGASER